MIFGKWFLHTCTLELRRPRAGLSAHSLLSHVFMSAYAMLAGLLLKTLYVELAHHYMLQLRAVAFVTPGYVVDYGMMVSWMLWTMDMDGIMDVWYGQMMIYDVESIKDDGSMMYG